MDNNKQVSIKIRLDDLKTNDTSITTEPLSYVAENSETIIESVTINRLQTDITKFRDDFEKNLKNELLTYSRICMKVPYLGRYLISFEPFKAYLSLSQQQSIYRLLYQDLFHYNIKLAYISYDYNNLSTQLSEMRLHLEHVLGEEYLAHCNAYLQAPEGAEREAILKQIRDTQIKIKNYIANSTYIKTLQSIGLSSLDQIDKSGTQYWRNAIQTQQRAIKDYEAKKQSLISANEPELLSTQYYTNLIHTASLLSSQSITLDDNTVVSGLYALICKYIGFAMSSEEDEDEEITSSIAHTYEKVLEEIQTHVFEPLYNVCGQYIYENTYENPDELDSVALYNQAITYFADLNRIQSSHSLTVLDIGLLDSIAVPRLSVGSVISVYNPNTPAAQSYASLLERIENARMSYEQTKALAAYRTDVSQAKTDIAETLSAYGHAVDALIHTYNADHIDKPVRTLAEAEERLCQDTVLVTGITRVLREPLKDSVTVEQSSRYKSILAKLIKSI